MRRGSNIKSIRRILYLSSLRHVLVPMLTIVTLLLIVFFISGGVINSRVEKLLAENAFVRLNEIARRETRSIGEMLGSVETLVKVMARRQEAFFREDKSCYLPYGEPSLKVHANGALYKALDNGGGTLYYAAGYYGSDEALRKARCSESLDPQLKAIVDNSHLVSQAYLNTFDNMSRIYPYIPEVAEVLGHSMQMADFNFFYLADPSHNPSREPVWTGAYLDPAGQGWMVSLIVPIYRDNFLEAVGGLDVTLETLLSNILDLDLPWNGTSLMVDAGGRVLAIQEHASKLLRLGKAVQELNKVEAPVSVVESAPVEQHRQLNVRHHTPVAIRDNFSRLLRSNQELSEMTLRGREFLVSQQTMARTNWRLINFVEKAEVFKPIENMRQLSTTIAYGSVGGMALFYVLFLCYMVYRAEEVTKSIVSPLDELAEQAR